MIAVHYQLFCLVFKVPSGPVTYLANRGNLLWVDYSVDIKQWLTNFVCNSECLPATMPNKSMTWYNSVANVHRPTPSMDRSIPRNCTLRILINRVSIPPSGAVRVIKMLLCKFFFYFIQKYIFTAPKQHTDWKINNSKLGVKLNEVCKCNVLVSDGEGPFYQTQSKLIVFPPLSMVLDVDYSTKGKQYWM